MKKQLKEPKKIKLKTIIILASIILFIIICMIVFRNTNITFTTNENFEIVSAEENIPDNAVEITDDEWIDIMYGQFFAIPITIIICIIIFILTKKYPNGDKEKIQEEIKSKKTVKAQVLYGYKYLLLLFLKIVIMFIPILVIHEFIHLLMMALFGIENMYVVLEWEGIFISPVYSNIAKWQMLLIQLMPSILFVIIIIVTVLLYPKSSKKSAIMLLLFFGFCGLCSATPDLMGAYNVIKIVPNGARFIETLESFYWYLL